MLQRYDVGAGEITGIAADTLAAAGLPELPSPGMVTKGVDIIVQVRAGGGRVR